MSTYSDEHKKFLKKKKIRKIMVIIVQIVIVIFFIGLWEFAARNHWINTFLTSSPSSVINTFMKLFNSNNLFDHIYVTLYETIISFLVASILGFIIASILWWNKFIADVMDPYLTILNSLPKVALEPLIIIIAGANTNSIIFMALMISLIISIINMYNGFVNTPNIYITLMKSFSAKKFEIYSKVIVPSNIPNIINALKINISMSLIGLLPPVGEKIFFNKCYSRYLFHYHLL